MNAPSPAELQRGSAYLAPRQASAAKVRRWQPFRNEARTMLGFLSVELPSGLVINDAKLMVGPHGPHWIALPATKQLDKDGNPKLDVNGRQVWARQSSNSRAGRRGTGFRIRCLRRCAVSVQTRSTEAPNERRSFPSCIMDNIHNSAWLAVRWPLIGCIR